MIDYFDYFKIFIISLIFFFLIRIYILGMGVFFDKIVNFFKRNVKK
jgi:hypothetical protein